MTSQIKKVIASFGEKDPGSDCWAWIIRNHHLLWQTHQAAVRSSDLPVMVETFKAMILAYRNRQTVQPSMEGIL